MTRTIFMIILTVLLFSCRKGEDLSPEFYDCNFSYADSSQSNQNNAKYQSLIDKICANGVVGITMSIYDSSSGYWNGASGKADLHNNIDMQACNILRVGSTVKTFTATTVLMLAEDGKLDLDDKISDYLQGDVINKIENADKATIRQLLQHSSGIYNYIQNLHFQTASLNDLIREWKPEDLLAYAYGKKSYFPPGEDVLYSNTGYVLLGMVIEKIEGKPFYQVFEERIFKPLELNNTKFAANNHVPNGIARGYIDVYSNLQVVESTYFSGWDYYTADGGLISNPYDLNVFMRALFRGELINANSLSEMLNFKTPKTVDSEFYPITYGLGVFKIETSLGSAYMHSGDAIGYYANMLYFPDKDIAITYAVNSNYGKIDQHISSKEAMDKIIFTVLQ